MLSLILPLFVIPSLGVIESDEVTEMPGYNGTLPSKQYSGMLMVPNTDPERFYHYWLVQSENDPDNDPIVVEYIFVYPCTLYT